MMDVSSSVWRVTANLAWLLSCMPDYFRFQVATWFPLSAQRKALRAILSRKPPAVASRLGARDFSSCTCTDHDTYRVEIDRIMRGCPNGLTTEPVLLLEPTSGSGATVKLIPYTPQLRREFRNAINPWIASLYLARPSLLWSTQYWSISPSTPFDPGQKSVVPIGFDTDAAYLSPLQKHLGSGVLTIPSAPSAHDGHSSFLYATAYRLLRDRHLGLISVWHPSFLLRLVELIRSHYVGMIRHMEGGHVNDEEADSGGMLRPLPHRAEELRAIDIQLPDAFKRIWPRLCIISCWADGNAVLEIDRVRSLFPGCAIQPKGLVATEAMVSIPIGLHVSGVCAVRSHVLEFIDLESGRWIPLRDLEVNRRYRIVVTTGNGFLRYALGDIIEVTGRYHRTPRLRFIARAGLVSDLVGEKIHAAQVAAIRDQLYQETGRVFTFFMISPLREGDRWRYALFVQPGKSKARLPEDLAARCDNLLAESYHYAHARQLGQLGAVRLFHIREGADETYLAYHIGRGMQRGAIKAEPLHLDSGWETRFRGSFQKETE